MTLLARRREVRARDQSVRVTRIALPIAGSAGAGSVHVEWGRQARSFPSRAKHTPTGRSEER
jgi:hypothetical protein